jgi:hypothetical protein
MEEKVFNIFNANHVKGKLVGFDFEITSIVLSRALFANSCSIKVDFVVLIPTHTKDSKNAW